MWWPFLDAGRSVECQLLVQNQTAGAIDLTNIFTDVGTVTVTAAPTLPARLPPSGSFQVSLLGSVVPTSHSSGLLTVRGAHDLAVGVAVDEEGIGFVRFDRHCESLGVVDDTRPTPCRAVFANGEAVAHNVSSIGVTGAGYSVAAAVPVLVGPRQALAFEVVLDPTLVAGASASGQLQVVDDTGTFTVPLTATLAPPRIVVEDTSDCSVVSGEARVVCSPADLTFFEPTALRTVRLRNTGATAVVVDAVLIELRPSDAPIELGVQGLGSPVSPGEVRTVTFVEQTTPGPAGPFSAAVALVDDAGTVVVVTLDGTSS